jgi:hypothetical protein
VTAAGDNEGMVQDPPYQEHLGLDPKVRHSMNSMLLIVSTYIKLPGYNDLGGKLLI